MKIPDAKAAVDEKWEKLEKLPAWQMTKVKRKKEVILEAPKRAKNSTCCVVNGQLWSQEFWVGATVSKVQRTCWAPRWHCRWRFRLLRGIHRNKVRLHLKWRPQKWWMSLQGYQIVQDRSKWKMPHRHSKVQSQNVQIIWYVYRNTNGQNHAWKTQSFLLSEICTVILWQDHTRKGNSRKFYQVPNWECSFVNRGLFLSVYVDGSKLVGKKQNIDSMWKRLMKQVHLGGPTSFLDHVYLGCTRRDCETSKDIVDNYKNMFASRISAGAIEKNTQLGERPDANISTWFHDMEGHAKKCVERNYELANKTTQQLYKVATPCLDDHQFKEEVLGICRRIAQICSQIAPKCQYLARIDRPDILWSLNKLARTVTKWTRACDKRLARLISEKHNTSEFQQCCHVGKYYTTVQVGTVLGLWLYQEILKTQNRPHVNFLQIWKSHVRANKLDVQEANVSFTQFNRIWNYFSWCWSTHGWNSRSRSLGFGHWIVPFFFQPIQKAQRESTRRPVAWHIIKRAHQHPNPESNSARWSWIVQVFSMKSSQFDAMLYIFEDNEAVIKMNMEGRSPTKRHESRTHRVALDWLFEIINLDPKIQIKNVHLMCGTIFSILCNISHFRAVCCSSEFQLCQLPKNDGEKDATRTRRRKNCGKVEADVKPGLEDWSKFFDCAKSKCIQPSRETQST